MSHDFNKPPHVTSAEEVQKKKRMPVFILIAVGVFLLALVVYMFADRDPKPSEAPPGHPNANVEQATPNNSTPAMAEEGVATIGVDGDIGTAVDGDSATATDGDTATATAQ
ncbi:flagellar basal body-associated FliL family protein [Acinetobacter indicus]|uniref:hypothetical protein n=1 Tax=Acinetobacter indicus TaxID=756892 RepID=UPI003989097D